MVALQEWAARLAIPGLPDWTGLLALLLLALVALAYLLMPFAVFGVKGRLEGIEAQLDELQAELRSLALRGPEAPARRVSAATDDWLEPPPSPRAEAPPPRAVPPIPPPPAWPTARGRAEPRFD